LHFISMVGWAKKHRDVPTKSKVGTLRFAHPT
jgi:hypothetical protein